MKVKCEESEMRVAMGETIGGKGEEERDFEGSVWIY